MTSPALSQRFIAALAAAVHEARASLGHPQWDEPGIAAAIRALSGTVDPAAVIVAFGRGLTDPTNETPAALGHLNNRAWDSDWYMPCPQHPETRQRHHPTGECAACRADRLGTDEALPLRRQGVPPTPETRAQLVAAFSPERAGDRRRATPTRSTVEAS